MDGVVASLDWATACRPACASRHCCHVGNAGHYFTANLTFLTGVHPNELLVRGEGDKWAR